MADQPDPIVYQPEPSEWDGLVCQFPDRTMYHTLAWLRVISDAHRARKILIAARVGERCVSVWPVLAVRKGPFRILGSPLPGWSSAYLGPLVQPGSDVPSVMNAMLRSRWLKRHSFFACRTMVEHQKIDLTNFGFQEDKSFDTYVVNLTLSKDQLWSNLKGECRTRVRKAEKLNVTIRDETSPDFLDDFWKMSQETFARSRIRPTHTREFSEAVWRHMSLAGRLLVISAIVNDHRAGMLVLPYDDRTLYYWGGASFQEFRSVPINNLLHWHAILRGKELGLKAYDMISTIGGPGRFKKTFGPERVVAADHWERTSSRFVAMCKDWYARQMLKKRRLAAPDSS